MLITVLFVFRLPYVPSVNVRKLVFIIMFNYLYKHTSEESISIIRFVYIITTLLIHALIYL